jgi:NADPH:quinone reductase-like Zn-dependent oxidoreductase
VAGLAGWVALDYRGHLQPGETVLVLGAGGSAGQPSGAIRSDPGRRPGRRGRPRKGPRTSR